METKEMKAAISKKFSKSARIMLACWVAIFALFTTLCFVYSEHVNYDSLTKDYWLTYEWLGIKYGYDPAPIIDYSITKAGTNYYVGMLCLVIFLNLFILIAPPLIYLLINRRKRKLTELTVNDKEIVGSYTSFIPISKITLKMPIKKIDNIAAFKNFFFLYTGKALRIASTSGVIRIPYVLNADELVAFISEMIEKAKGNQKPTQLEKPQGDVADSLKKLAELRNAGIITEEEFNQKKSELLGKM